MNAHWNGTSSVLQQTGVLGTMLALVAALAGLAGCASPEPLSYLDGARFNRVEINTFDTLIVSVDGKSYTTNTRIPVSAGRHTIVFQTTPSDGFPYSPQKALDVDIQPCTRYWFEAKKANALSQDFEPRVNYSIHIPGCGVASADAGSRY